MKTQTEHKIRNHISAHPTATESEMAAAASETQAAASPAMVEACDRLSQKLDEVTAIIKEQLQAWQQIPELAGSNSGGNETAAHPAVDSPATQGIPISRTPESGNFEINPTQETASLASAKTGASETNGSAAVAERARHLIETLSRSRDGWQEQAASLQQALEAIMDFLEGQAAATAATPKVDVTEIVSRLRNLEEEQQNLRSQMSVNRWGPS
jgi:t-SNARE complex subunit (syntaxin)